MEKIIKLPLSLPIGQIYEIDGNYYQSVFCNRVIDDSCDKCDLTKKLCDKVNITCHNIYFKQINKYEVLFNTEKDSDK